MINNKPRSRGLRERTRHFGSFRRENYGRKNFKLKEKK